jgi:hypothetical protein
MAESLFRRLTLLVSNNILVLIRVCLVGEKTAHRLPTRPKTSWVVVTKYNEEEDYKYNDR